MSLLAKVASLGVGELLKGVGSFAKDIRQAITGEISQEKKAEILQRAQELEFASDNAQTMINLKEAEHPSVFVSGWRPAAGWTCVAGLAYNFLAYPLMGWLIAIINGLFSYSIVAPGKLDIVELITLLMGMLGFGSLRTYERMRDVNRLQ